MRTLVMIALVSGCVADEVAVDDKAQAAADADALPEDGKADGFDVCAVAGWYGDGVCDRFCARLDPDCPAIGTDPAIVVRRR